MNVCTMSSSKEIHYSHSDIVVIEVCVAVEGKDLCSIKKSINRTDST